MVQLREIVDTEYRFVSVFDADSGAYYRSGVIEEGKSTGMDPFMGSFPQLLDIGIMGHCLHGESGLCAKAGVECYQQGPTKHQPNMALADYRRIIDESKGRVFQVALGGRGDPELHEDFEALAAYTRQNDIVPNLTTSGFGLTPARARIIARYCGAAAVSWYRSEYTLRAIELMLEAGIKTNIHFVLSNSSIEEALRLLETGGFPPGINRVVFLLHKPVGLGTQDNVLQANDPRVQQFFSLVSEPENTALVGFDSCTVPGLINMAPTLLPMTYDACEGARFSAYVTPDLKLTPCSFDQTLRWGVDLRKLTIAEAWNSTEFEAFRETLRSSCRRCRHRARCLGGCPISPEITLCEKAQLEGTT